jgi:hypothetical protein
VKRGRRAALVLAWLAWTVLTASLPCAAEARAKLGPAAISIQQSHEYLQSHRAPDYWALSPYYAPQETNSACSLAAIAMLVNALRGLPSHAADPVVTPKALLNAVSSDQWMEETSEGGSGVTWEELERYVRLSLAAFNLFADVEILKPQDDSQATLEQVRRMLAQNERDDRDLVLVYFNQGVLTGDWDGPHISPIAAYDAEQRRVLIMDVDRQWYIPYWSSDEMLLEAMRRPAPAERGRLAGETGGLVRVILRPPR